MKEIFEKFGLAEFFAYVCPGAVLLLSLALWIRVDFAAAMWKQQFLVGAVLLVLAYILGLGVASFGYTASAHYLRLTARKSTRWWTRLWTSLLRAVYLFPTPRTTPAIVQINLSIAEDLSRLSGVSGLSSLVTPWDWLPLYRAVMADRLGDKAKTVLAEADTLQRRFRFCMGVALALLRVAVQAAVRLVLKVLEDAGLGSFGLPTISWVVLIGFIVGGLWVSFGLRHVAVRMWELERYLTASLTQHESRAAEAHQTNHT